MNVKLFQGISEKDLNNVLLKDQPTEKLPAYENFMTDNEKKATK